MSDWDGMTDEEFSQRVLEPVLAEARRRKFTVKLDPFDVLPKRPAGDDSRYRHLTGQARQDAVDESNLRAAGDPYGG